MSEPLLTRYFMLSSKDNGTTWTYEGTQDAHNGDAAARKFYGVLDDGWQALAIPERSWKPLMRQRKVVESYVNAPVDVGEPVAEDAQEDASGLPPVEGADTVSGSFV